MRKTVFLIALAVAGYVRAHPALLQEGDELGHIRAYLRLSDHLATSGQILYEQIKDIKKAGFEVVVNLAPAHKERNALEDFLVTEQSMTYVHIPVSWTEPSLRDLKLFFDVMEANAGRKIYVHCFANMNP